MTDSVCRVTVFSCVRLYYLVELYIDTNPDANYSISFVTSAIEANLAIITGSVPALWPLVRGRVGTTRNTAATSQQQYYAGNTNGWVRTQGESDNEEALELGDMRGMRPVTEISRTSILETRNTQDGTVPGGRVKSLHLGGGITKTVDIEFVVSKADPHQATLEVGRLGS